MMAAAPCLGVLRLSCVHGRLVSSRSHNAVQFGVRTMASRRKEQQKAAPAQETTPADSLPEPLAEPLPEPQADFFEGEAWDVIGNVLSYSVPALIVLALAVGGFAAGTYNEGATVFIDTPRSPEDTVRFFTVAD